MCKYLLSAFLLLPLVPGAAQPVPKVPPEKEAALRERVTKFYTFFQESKFRQAENLVAEESKDKFYTQSKIRIGDFKIDKVDFDDSLQAAKVRVLCLFNTPHTTGLNFYVPVIGKWKLLEGDWFLVFEPRTMTPFGPIAQTDPAEPKQPRPLPPMERPDIGAIAAGSFSIDPQQLVLPLHGQPVTRAVMVKNNLPGPLTLAVEGADLPGLHLVLESKQLPAKSSVSFHLKYNPE